MNAVPRIFIESVCLCLDHASLWRSGRIPSLWGEVTRSTRAKIHTLCVSVNEPAGRLFAAARPTNYFYSLKYVPLDRVDLKFINNFRIASDWVRSSDPSSSWKEISLENLQRLVRFIRPTTEGRPPLLSGDEPVFSLKLRRSSNIIIRNIFSLRLPVVFIHLWFASDMNAELEKFLENTGPLYQVACNVRPLKPSTVNALIRRFVPVDGGIFKLYHYLTREQLERLVLKCEISGKKVTLKVWLQGYYSSWDTTDFFGLEMYYPKRRIEGGPYGEICTTRKGARLQLRVRAEGASLRWKWSEKQ
uniref:FBA_2 domain-containing protein n=1 Tax=Steinernema glaseri TaxID=37863 RepID=A0A1I7YE91_9BILA